ncbi:hypothetical protein [Saccharopolyspora shandongensis]
MKRWSFFPSGGEIGDEDLDKIRNVCRCGTYQRIREAIRAGADATE